jgi:hypothetical protein
VVRRSTESYKPRGSSRIWFACFQQSAFLRNSGLPSLPAPALSRTGSFSHELCVHFRDQLTCHPPVQRATGISPGVSFPFATSAHGVHLPLSFQTQLRSALSVSHTLDGLLLPVPSWVCFVPQPRPGFHFRGFPCRSADSSHRRLVPSCRYRRPPAAEYLDSAGSRQPAFRVFIRAAVRCY